MGIYRNPLPSFMVFVLTPDRSECQLALPMSVQKPSCVDTYSASAPDSGSLRDDLRTDPKHTTDSVMRKGPRDMLHGERLGRLTDPSSCQPEFAYFDDRHLLTHAHMTSKSNGRNGKTCGTSMTGRVLGCIHTGGCCTGSRITQEDIRMKASTPHGSQVERGSELFRLVRITASAPHVVEYEQIRASGRT